MKMTSTELTELMDAGLWEQIVYLQDSDDASEFLSKLIE